MKVPVIKKLAETYSLEELQNAEKAIYDEQQPSIEVEGEDEGEQLTHIIAAIWIKNDMAEKIDVMLRLTSPTDPQQQWISGIDVTINRLSEKTWEKTFKQEALSDHISDQQTRQVLPIRRNILRIESTSIINLKHNWAQRDTSTATSPEYMLSAADVQQIFLGICNCLAYPGSNPDRAVYTSEQLLAAYQASYGNLK